ncbi:hypothetical protein GCM10007231_10910 [Nocardioides daphniae]|uniref:Secreted protein n=1 Tax=Nocardioides daphniae TaxID=402297 RepID=A0ABQ1Q5J5_9ACTN|nr:hypothetical protein GCM10007231_10910 [Nocardioides daphniae]
MLKRWAKTIAVVAALSCAPASATAVAVSSNNGDGNAWLQSWIEGSAWNDSRVRSSTGKIVYISGGIGVPLSGDYKCHQKVAPDTTSSTYRNHSNRRCNFLWPENGIQGFKYQHCRNLNNLPDPCGAWSKNGFS